jgi:hypothetical protein
VNGALAPTAKLRFIVREIPDGDTIRHAKILQQWWCENVPSYMQGSEGEWRDIECVTA